MFSDNFCQIYNRASCIVIIGEIQLLLIYSAKKSMKMTAAALNWNVFKSMDPFCFLTLLRRQQSYNNKLLYSV